MPSATISRLDIRLVQADYVMQHLLAPSNLSGTKLSNQSWDNHSKSVMKSFDSIVRNKLGFYWYARDAILMALHSVKT